MSDITLIRKIFTNKSTVGKLIMGDLELFTLEDTARKKKIYGETCIPSGTYDVIIRDSERYKRLMPSLVNVPYFDGILIHWGNFPENTHGCLLVGTDHTTSDKIDESLKAFNLLYPKIEEALKTGPLKIHIVGGYSKDDFESRI